jgi:circadian clock protein KaiC
VNGAAKIRTGVPGLDKMLHGGLVPARPYILSGPPGAGKTILSVQFLREGLEGGERCLFVALEEPPNELKLNMRPFRWNLDDLEVLDANSDIRRFEPTPILEISTEEEPARMRDLDEHIRKTPDFESREVTVHSLQQLLKNVFLKRQYERVVIDSITALKYFCMREFEEILTTQSFMRFLAESKVTSLLTLELPEEGEVPPEAFLARGEVRLHKFRDDTGIRRVVSIEKYKGSSHDDVVYPFEITNAGVAVQSGTAAGPVVAP